MRDARVRDAGLRPVWSWAYWSGRRRPRGRCDAPPDGSWSLVFQGRDRSRPTILNPGQKVISVDGLFVGTEGAARRPGWDP
jgi:hypothetical protein